VKYRGEFYYGTHNQANQHNYCELRRLDWGTRRLRYPPKGPYAVWDSKSIDAGEYTPAILVKGYSDKVIHFVNNTGSAGDLTIEVDISGDGNWQTYDTPTVSDGAYESYELTTNCSRVRASFANAGTVSLWINLEGGG